MSNHKKQIVKPALFIIIVLIMLWFLKDFNLSWVEVNEDHAEVTINFLFPMAHDKLSESIEMRQQPPYKTNFNYTAHWLTKSVVEIKLQEDGIIKGQKARLLIKNLPSTLPFISKNVNIPIQFKSNVALVDPLENRIIATEKPFFIKFNTPMNKNKINEFLACDTKFYIEPLKVNLANGKEIEDTSCFKFIPKTPLNNDKKYILSFRKGMPSQSGTLLENELSVVLTTDSKPILEETYPNHQSKWIGLYPKLILETKTPVAAAYVKINNENIKGISRDPYHIEFLLNHVLNPNTTYEAHFQAETEIGELSQIKTVQFTTVEINDSKLWIEVLVGNTPKVKVYKGKEPLKTMLCSLGTQPGTTPLGTYYIQSKEDTFTNSKEKEGANFWLKLSDHCGFQGLIRDDYWQVKNKLPNQLGYTKTSGNILLSDEDAQWLYENIPENTMVIIHKNF